MNWQSYGTWYFYNGGESWYFVCCLFLLLEKMNMVITVICRYNICAYIYNNEDIFQKKTEVIN